MQCGLAVNISLADGAASGGDAERDGEESTLEGGKGDALILPGTKLAALDRDAFTVFDCVKY